MHKKDIWALVARVAGLSILATDATFVTSVNTIFGAKGPIIVGVIGLVTTLAADVIRIFGAPSGTVVLANSADLVEEKPVKPADNTIHGEF